MSCAAEKISSLHDEFIRFVDQHGVERSKILQRRINTGNRDISWPLTIIFFRGKGYHALATNEGLRFFADQLK